jgi:hypothetical protein
VYLEVVDQVGPGPDGYGEARDRAERRLDALVAALEPRLSDRA